MTALEEESRPRSFLAGISDTVGAYRRALRDEPKARLFFIWTLIDDLGTAVGAWASVALNNDVIRTPEAEAALALPALTAMLIGNAISGPLADWPGKHDLQRLSRWRYRVVVWRYVVFTLFGVVLVAALARGHAPFGFFVVFMVVQQFVAAAGAASRAAFFVDILRTEEPQVDAQGHAVLDEEGQRREFKTHLLTIGALLDQTSSIAALLGLLVGGWLMHAVHDRYWILLGFDVATYGVFAIGVAWVCHPQRSWRQVRWHDLFREPTHGEIYEDAVRRVSLVPGESRTATSSASPRRSMAVALLAAGAAHTRDSLRALWQFAKAPENRSFARLMALGWATAVLGSVYDARLIVTRVLGLGLEYYRYVQIGSYLGVLLAMQLVVAMRRRMGRLGWIVVVACVLDGLAMLSAGTFGTRALALRHVGAVVFGAALPVAIGIVADAALTGALTSLSDLAQRSVSSPALRGRIVGGVSLVAVLLAMIGEQLYPRLTERFGQTRVLMFAGALQIVLAILFSLGRGGAASFGLRTSSNV